MFTNRPSLLVPVLAALTLAGCNSGISYEHAQVRGKVTYQGKPVPFGSVLFVPMEPPKDGLMQPASSQIQADGTYELNSQETGGAIVGEHKVVVVAMEGDKVVEPPPNAAPTPSKNVSKAQFKSAVPRKYADPTTTPLTRKVVSGPNTIDLELVD